MKNDKRDELLKVRELYNAEAVQLLNISLPSFENEHKPLKKYLGQPKFIPYDWDAKIAYAKTCSEELQRHITEKRGIKL